MTIRRRLALSFFAILALFAINLAVYFWGVSQRTIRVAELREAIDRDRLIASVDRAMRDLDEEVRLLSKMPASSGRAGALGEQVAAFEKSVDAVDRETVAILSLLEEGPERAVAAETVATFRQLRDSWLVFYREFSTNHERAIAELTTRSEPLSRRLIERELPRLEADERRRVQHASADYARLSALTHRISVSIFIASILAAALIEFVLSRYLGRNLLVLKAGAERVGSGDFNHRITIATRDELGALATAYNEMAARLDAAHKQMTEANRQLDGERRKSEDLLLNILPRQVARELKEKGAVQPKYFEDATILFTDFVGFTLSTETLAAEKLVELLHEYFTAFDKIAERYHMEKLKTIGDSYMAAAGLPVGRRTRRTPSHPVDAVLAAMEMVRAVVDIGSRSPVQWGVRIGLHTGPVIAGVVGIRKFAFDMWGETVNMASRHESAGVRDRINISERTFSRVKDFFECELRGKVMTKDKREFDMYLVKGVLPDLMEAASAAPLPPAFQRRYNVYFQKDPPAFPEFLLAPASESSAASS